MLLVFFSFFFSGIKTHPQHNLNSFPFYSTNYLEYCVTVSIFHRLLWLNFLNRNLNSRAFKVYDYYDYSSLQSTTTIY